MSYNDEGDEKWHVMGLDTLTGAVKLDIPENFLRGTADLDGAPSLHKFLKVATQGNQP